MFYHVGRIVENVMDEFSEIIGRIGTYKNCFDFGVVAKPGSDITA